MDSNKIERLIKSDSNIQPSGGNTNLEYLRRKINGILASLRKPVTDYRPEKTVTSIRQYLSSDTRILYSQLTSVIYSLSDEEKTTILTNLERLLHHVIETEKEGSAIYNSVIRLWDHFNLACQQVENVRNGLITNAENTQKSLYDKLYNELSDVKKEYIAILGIFSAVVLTFTAGIAFSTSVLENMHQSSAYRVVLVILLIGFVLFNVLYTLFEFLRSLSQKKSEKLPIGRFVFLAVINLLLIAAIIATIIFWHRGFIENRNANINNPQTSITESLPEEDEIEESTSEESTSTNESTPTPVS